MKALLAAVAFVVTLGLAIVPARADSAAAYSPAVKVTPLLKTQVDSAGQAIAYPTGGPAEITGVLVEIAPGGETGWHHHPVPALAYMLEGEVDVTLADGRVVVYRAGQAAAEVVDLLHNGRNPGPGPAKLVFFALGTAGQPYAIKSTAAPEAP